MVKAMVTVDRRCSKRVVSQQDGSKISTLLIFGYGCRNASPNVHSKLRGGG